jgi:hypothetical protein
MTTTTSEKPGFIGSGRRWYALSTFLKLTNALSLTYTERLIAEPIPRGVPFGGRKSEHEAVKVEESVTLSVTMLRYPGVGTSQLSEAVLIFGSFWL